MLGQTISHYTILEKLGEGGMGVVYRAHDTALEREVALKFLPHYLTTDPVEKERFYHEARAAAALTHQNIAVVYEIAEHEGRLFIAMEYIQGETLKKLVNSPETPSIRKVLDIAIQICEGLAAAHEKGIVHRDIKSDNIILTPKGQPKIMDFGLAKVKGATKLTKTGSTLGTAAYMSPEQARGEEVDHRSDIFSFGVVLYEMLTGRLPFRGEHPTALMYSIVNEEPQPLARFNEKATPEIERIVAKALAKEREERYQHSDEILSDLRHERKMMEYARSGYTVAAQRVAAAPAGPSGPAESARLSEPAPPASTGVPASGARRPIPRSIKIFAATGIATLLIAGIFLLRPMLFEEAVSSERRTVAVISFVNQTGDDSYDYLQDAIPNLLITNLEQSKYLHVTTWERLHDLLGQAGKKGTTFIDRDLGFELCKMDGIEAIVLGSFTKAGDVFATDVKVLDVRTKELLKSVNAKGDGVASILRTQIDDLSREVARGIGIPERRLESTPMQIAEQTTSSMEAYNYYIRGVADFQKFYLEEAKKFLEKAVSIDSTFAIAWVNLAFTHTRLNDEKAAAAAFQMAARYSGRAPEKERLMISSALAAFFEKNQEKALSLMQEVVEKYPKEKSARFALGAMYSHRRNTSGAIEELTATLRLDPEYGPALNQLGYVYADVGEYEKALECFRKYASTNPGDANPLDSMAELYFRMGRLDDAVTKYTEVLELKPGFAWVNLCLGYVLLLRENPVEGMKRIDQYISEATTPGLKGEGYWDRASFGYSWQGKFRQSLGDLDKARALFSAADNEKWITLTDALEGFIRFDRNETDASLRPMVKYFEYLNRQSPPDNKPAIEMTARGYVALREGRIAEARSRLSVLDSLLAGGDTATVANTRYNRQMLHAEILIHEGSFDEAVRAAEQAGLPLLPNFDSEKLFWYNSPFVRDVKARAYAGKGEIDKAIAEYEKICTFDPAGRDRRLILPKYHYALAKLLDRKGARERALREYETFLTFWKDADPDLSEVVEARSRLAVLRNQAKN